MQKILIKWKGKSYLHVSFRTELQLVRANAKIVHKLKAYNRTAPPMGPAPVYDEAVSMEDLLKKAGVAVPAASAATPDAAKGSSATATGGPTAEPAAGAPLDFAPFPVVVPRP